MKAKVLLTVASLVLAPLSAQAIVEVGAKGVFWFPRLSGDFEVGTGPGNAFIRRGDIEDLASDENALLGEVFLRGGSHELSFSGTRFNYSGDQGSLDYTMLDLVWEWDVINLRNVAAGFALGPVLQVKYLDGTVEVDPILGIPVTGAREDFTAAVPLIGLGLNVGLLKDILEARARVAGIGFRGNTLVDAMAEVSWNLLPFIELVGGYRHIALNLDTDKITGDANVVLDFTQSGPYLGLSVKLGI